MSRRSIVVFDIEEGPQTLVEDVQVSGNQNIAVGTAHRAQGIPTPRRSALFSAQAG